MLARAAVAASGALARNVDQLGNALPRGTTSRGVLAAGQELFSLGAGLGLLLVDLVIVGNVEVVDILLGLAEGGFLLLLGNLSATGELGIALFTPQTNRLRLLLIVLQRSRSSGRERGTGSGDCTARGNSLFNETTRSAHPISPKESKK
jgi:hypothetical protein